MNTEIEKKLYEIVNEEKWTRAPLTSYTEKSVKELQTIIECIEPDDFSDALTLMEDHLQDNHNSFAALYIGGILTIHSHGENDAYLTKLVQLLFDNQRKSLAEYIIRNTPELLENSFALRTLANILQAQEDTEELLVIQQKIAELDPTETDLLLHIAQQKEQQGNMPGAIADYKNLLYRYVQKKQFSKIRELWQNLIILSPKEVDFYYHIIGKCAETLGSERAVQLLELFYPLFREEQDTEACIAFLKKILSYDAHNANARKQIIACFRELHKDNENLESYIQNSNLEQEWRNVHEAIADFQKHVAFRPGNFVYHKSWGVGLIRQVENNSIILDFAKVRNHKMVFNMASAALEVLPATHIRVLKSIMVPAKLAAKVRKDTMWTLETILKSYGVPVDFKAIRNELVPSVLSPKEWTSWSVKARQLLRTSPRFGIDSAATDSFILKEDSREFDHYAWERFENHKSFEERVKILIDYFSSSTSINPKTVSMSKLPKIYQYFSNHSKNDPNQVQTVASALVLEFIPDVLKETLATHTPIQDILPKLTHIPDIYLHLRPSLLQKTFMQALKKYEKNWKESLVELFPYAPSRDMLRLLEAQDPSFLEKIFKNLLKSHNEFRYSFVWFIRKLGISKSFDQFPIKYEKVMIALLEILNSVQTEINNKINISENRKTYHHIITYLFTEKHLIQYLQEENEESVRQVYTLLETDKSVDAKRRMEIQQILLQRFPALAGKFAGKRQTQNDSRRFFTTAASFSAKQTELSRLATEDIPATSKEIEKARSYGDLKENAEYKAAKEKQATLNSRTNRLKADLSNAQIIQESEIETSQVRFGTKVVLRHGENGKTVTYTVLGPWESDPDQNVISYRSQLGFTLYGKKLGDLVEIMLNEEKQQFVVEHIEISGF